MLSIKNGVKSLADIINREIYRVLKLIRGLTRNRFNAAYFSDMISTNINRLIKNEFILNPKEHLYIEVSNICNLRCRFCGYSKTSNKKLIMSNGMFFDIINKATAFGYDTFGLTPITGEVFIDKNFITKLKFLENHPKVKNYSFYTNFTLANEEIIDWLIEAKKLKELSISIYGHDYDSFSAITGSNEKTYNNLISNLNYLLKRCKKKKIKLRFSLRTYTSFNTLEECKSELCHILMTLIKITKSKILIPKVQNTWGGYITQDDVKGLDIIIGDATKIYKNGACLLIFYKNQVLVDGRINACACRDINATLKIGDLQNQTFDEIYSINNKDYKNLIDSQQKGDFNPICENCDFYRSIYKKYNYFTRYKKKPLTLEIFYQNLSRK